MATFLTLHPYNPFNFPPNSSPKYPFHSLFSKRITFTVLSTHSNPNIIKTNRRSTRGKPLSLHEYDEELYDIDDDEEDEEEEEDDDDDDFFSDEEFTESADFDAIDKRSKSKTRAGRHQENGGDVKSLKNGKSSKSSKGQRKAPLQQNYSEKFGKISSVERSQDMFEEIDSDVKLLPLLDYLRTFGFNKSELVQIYEKHKPSLRVNVCSAQEKLDYLMSLGVKHKNIRRILLRQPQILGYAMENNLKTHVAFFMSLGVPSSKIGQLIAGNPTLFAYSVERSLKPRVRYLIEEVGIDEIFLGKVINLSPQIILQSIDILWNTRLMFFTKELGASKESIVKMVTKHPQLLHYSIDDGLLPKIKFLRSIGMDNADILKILTSLTQVLSLSLEANLKPKYLYLVNELHNEARSLTKYPAYLTLSLDKRIRPRHRFLVSLKKAPKGPFPLSSLLPTDENFCQKYAKTTLDKYMAFCQRLSLQNLAEKYNSKMLESSFSK